MDYRFEFGHFYIDTIERLLIRDGERITLKNKAIEVLLLLLKKSPAVVERESFMNEIWPDTFVEEGSLTVSISEIRKAVGRGSDGRHYIETLPGRGYRFTPEPKRVIISPSVQPPHKFETSQSPQSTTERAIAVLPFINTSSDPSLDYLADGFAETIINRLSHLNELRVKASGSSFRFRGREAAWSEISRELGVVAIVTGRLFQLREKLIVRVALVDAISGNQLWGEQYDRNSSDLIEVQVEISAEVAKQLRIRLTGEDERRLAKRSTDSHEAYRAYLKGRYFWSKRPQAGFMKGLDYFRQAIDLDPSYALAYAGLADAYGVLGSWEAGFLPPREAATKARAAAIRALEIDEDLAEGHTSLAYVALHYDWDWTSAEQGFKRALELNPSYVHAHHWYSHLCVVTGRIDKAYEVSVRALELDPLDLIVNVHLAWHYWITRDPSRAIEQSLRTRELDPDSLWCHFFCGLAYEEQGRYVEAVAQLKRASELSTVTTFALAGQAHASALAADKPSAEAALRKMEQATDDHYIPAYDKAIICVGLGDRERAMRYLLEAFEEHSSWMAYLNVEPRLDPLRDDVRFIELLKRVGLTKRTSETGHFA